MIDSILLRSIDILTPQGLRTGDLLIRNGKIAQLAPSISDAAELIIHEKGLTVLPGVIDPHVHFREPGNDPKETLESGSKAAAAGGVTSYLDMPNNKPPTITAAQIAAKKQRASKTSKVNYNFFIGATRDNLDELNTTPNIPGIKIFVGSSTGDLLVDDPKDLERLFANGTRLIAVHSEDEATVLANKERYKNSTNPADHEKIRSPEAALKSTKFLVGLALKHRRRLHILHLTTEEEVLFLNTIPKNPYVTSEVCVQHLLIHGPGLYEKWGAFAQINPPLRENPRHAAALWQALKDGTIQCIATDHAPHTIEEKRQPFGKAPSGMPGVETALPLMLTQAHQKNCTLEQVARWMSQAPAELYKMQTKGQLKEGWDADLVIVDLNKTKTLTNKTQHTQCAWTLFENWKVTGIPLITIVNGQIAYREGDFPPSPPGKEIQILP